MRKPNSPPKTEEIFDYIRNGDKSFLDILTAVREPVVNGKYLHWDELRRRNPPDNLSPKIWWYALKFRRLDRYKSIPLESKSKGGAFRYLDTDPIPEKLHHITQRASGQVQVPEQVINPDTKDRYYVSSLMEEAITSSQLEGAATTRQIAKEMIRTGRKPRDTSERMILNNYITMRKIGDFKDKPLTKERLLEIHRLVTEKTLGDESTVGRLRTRDDKPVVVTDEEGEILHVPPPSEELDYRVGRMCEFANDSSNKPFIHPVIRSIILHFWLVYDHPFVDGNGRTARALFYWSMLNHGYWLFEFITISKIILKGPTKYALAFLYTETDDNDLTYFILYHLDIIIRSIDELYAYIRKQSEQLRNLERNLRGLSDLNHRQKALISHAIKNPYHKYTFESHRTSHAVAYQTGRTDILDLVRRGLLRRAGKQGRTQFFSPVPELQEKLTNLSNPT